MHLYFVAVVGDDDDVSDLVESYVKRLADGLLGNGTDLAVTQLDQFVQTCRIAGSFCDTLK